MVLLRPWAIYLGKNNHLNMERLRIETRCYAPFREQHHLYVNLAFTYTRNDEPKEIVLSFESRSDEERSVLGGLEGRTSLSATMVLRSLRLERLRRHITRYR
jgi:hypothetical protein